MYRKPRSNMVKQYPGCLHVSPVFCLPEINSGRHQKTLHDLRHISLRIGTPWYPQNPMVWTVWTRIFPAHLETGTVPVQRRAGDPISQRWFRFVQARRGNSAVHFCGVLSLSRSRLFCHFWRWKNSWFFDSFCCFSYWVCENRALANVRFPTN